MKLALRLLLAAVIIAAGAWLYLKLFPGDETVIRKTLLEVERYASFNSDEKPVSRLANVQKLASFFTEDMVIRINFNDGSRSMEGRESLRQAAMAARNTLSSLRLEFVTPQIQVSPERDSATILMTMKATPSDGELQVQNLKLTMRKFDGRWVISRVETLKSSNFKQF